MTNESGKAHAGAYAARPMVSPLWRDRAIGELSSRTFDLLVVGGGILGAGVARDAAMRGLSVALVEQYDFAFGTSSRSSRLLHGGLRYLAQGRLGLVREAGREKAVLARIAPHLAAPLAFIFPAYEGTQWPRWQLSVGVRVYDLLCGVADAPRSSAIGREQTLKMLPRLRPAGLTGSVRYGDGLTNDARLVIDSLRSAQHHGAVLVSRARFEAAKREAGIWQCRMSDQLGGGEIGVRAKGVVNVAGPWAGRLEHSSVKLRLTKGVHLVVDKSKLPLVDAVVMAEGNRILFAIPYGERVILGTTDTDYAGKIEDVRTDESDAEYILGVTRRTFPECGIAREDVIAEWAGLRPLIAKGAKGARGDGSPSEISRKHLILESEEGWFDVAGGKLTTYRHIAEETLNRVVQGLDLNARRCATHEEPLLEGLEGAEYSGIVPPAVSEKVVSHFVRNEWAMSVEDVMARRGRWNSYSPDAGDIARRVAEWMPVGP